MGHSWMPNGRSTVGVEKVSSLDQSVVAMVDVWMFVVGRNVGVDDGTTPDAIEI